jgi:hypothetical protein
VFTPASTTLAATATTLTVSATQVTSGQSVTFTATVTPTSGSGTPTGSVTFFDGATQLATATLNTSGVATFSSSTLALGTHTVTAVYAGDSNFSTSTSAAATVTIVAPAKTNTTTTLSASATEITSGQAVTLTATVAPVSGSNSPTGAVTFFDGTTQLGTATLNSSGVAAYTAMNLATGAHSVTAAYGGDTNFAASTSAAVSVTVSAPPKTATTTALSASATQLTSGQSVTFTATVKPQSGTSTPTGSVAFLDGGTQINSSALSAGSASFTIATLATGSHTITASYSGDANNSPSVSAGQTVTVVAALTPDYTLSMSTSALTLAAGSSGKFTITVTAIDGFKQALALSCSSLPPGGTCSFNPPSVNPASGPATATVTVHAPSSTQAQIPLPNPFSDLQNAALTLLGITVAFIAAAVGKRKAATEAVRFAPAFLTCAMIAMLLALAGCASTSQPPAQATTYDVTVTASAANSPTHTGQFVLTVTP